MARIMSEGSGTRAHNTLSAETPFAHVFYPFHPCTVRVSSSFADRGVEMEQLPSWIPTGDD